VTSPTPIDPSELAPATGAAQPLEGWRGADIDPSELVNDAWIAANTTPLVERIELDERSRFGASGAGWTRDTVRRVAARTGLPVVEAWSSHDLGAMGTVVAPLLHHTGSDATAPGDYPTLRVVRDGRPGLINSLCMYGLGRSGTVYLISERLSWHAGAGSFGGITDGNGHLAGIEAESDGRGWTPEQIDAYPRLVASILLETGRGAEWTPRHGDYALPVGRKTDTSGLDIAALRATVAYYLAHPEQITRGGAAPQPQEGDDVAKFDIVRDSETGAMYLAAPGRVWGVPSLAYLTLATAFGMAALPAKLDRESNYVAWALDVYEPGWNSRLSAAGSPFALDETAVLAELERLGLEVLTEAQVVGRSS